MTATFGGKKHWLLVTDYSSNYIWSFFLKKISNLVDILIVLIKTWRNEYNLQVQYLCCYSESENVTFKKACKQEGLGVDFKYTVSGMPQQNSCSKEFFALFNWVCTMLNGVKLDAYLQNSLWAKVASTTIFHKNNLLTPNRMLIPFLQFFGEGKRSILPPMQIFGEMCITQG